MSDADGKGFTVRDRRRVDERGETRTGAGEDAGEDAPGEERGARPENAGPIDFTTFLVSLSSSAFYHLGEVPHPQTGRAETNLVAAKQTIDLLGLLQEKTRGNLTREESQVLEGLLYELRVKYVEKSRSPRPDTAEKPGAAEP